MQERWRGCPLQVIALLAVACIACSEPASPELDRVDLAAEWQTATPASVGIDDAALAAAFTRAQSLPRLLSLVVVRRGRLVAEGYFNGNHRDSLNDVRSVTKSVVSTLAGIAALEHGLHADSPIGGRLQEWAADLDAERGAIRIRDLLTMSAGFQWDESTASGYNQWVLSPDPVAYVLRRPLVHPRGTTFAYNSGAVHLLSIVVEKYAGMQIDELAAAKLWPKLGIQRVRWEIFPHDGRPNGGAGLDLRPRDLAKLGWLMLRDGTADERVIDDAWVGDATRPAFSWWTTWAPLNEQNYGWLWWLYRGSGRTAYFAWGHGGQFLWVDPQLELIVVVTTEWRGASGPAAAEGARAGLDLIINHVVPAVR